MDILKYFIETEMNRRQLLKTDIANDFDQIINQLEDIKLKDYQRVIEQIFTPYELIIINDLSRQYRKKTINKKQLYSTYLQRKIEALPLLLLDKEIEIGEIVSHQSAQPISIVISFKYDLSLTFDFAKTENNKAMIEQFEAKGKLKDKVAFLNHLINHHHIHNHNLIILNNPTTHN